MEKIFSFAWRDKRGIQVKEGDAEEGEEAENEKSEKTEKDTHVVK